MPMTYKEYNRLRYRKDMKHSFLISVRSYIRILTALGATVFFPDEESFDANVDAYLLNRPTRNRPMEEAGEAQ